MLSIANRAEEAVQARVFPGCVIGVVKKSGLPAAATAQAGEREIFPYGYFRYEDSPSVVADTIYDVASITKSIPSASLALNFLQKGTFNLSDPVTKYIPELHNDYGATIEDLLRYRVRGPQLSVLKDKTPEGILQYIFEHGFEGPPQESVYTNLPALLLGIVVERAGGGTLDSLAQEYFFGPLEMKNTMFLPGENSAIYRTIAPTEIVDGQELRGIVHDESARVFARAGKAVGHAGLFSTATDILNLLEALLQGKYRGVLDGAQRGLGWELNQPFMGKYAGPHTFGKTGFTGISCVCDRERGVAFVVLSNCTYPVRPKDRSAIDAFRADIADIVFS